MYDDSFKIRYTLTPVAISETNDVIKGETYPHLHKETEILYIEKGNAKIKIDKNELLAKSGDIVFVNPLEVHSVEVENEKDYHHKCICFDTSLIADEKIREDIENGFLKLQCVFEHNDTLIELFMKLFFAVKEDKESLFFESIAYISMMFSYFVKNNFFIRSVTSQTNELFYKKVCDYIKMYYCENISSKDIAKEIGYTQSYFCRAFKKCFSVNFSEYLNMYRISMSKKALENENAKISDVAYECGFESPVYFARCFKKYIGMTPAQYKKCQYKY